MGRLLRGAEDVIPDTVDLEEKESSEVIEKNGGDDGARTRDLRRDRPAF
jgi:hypothetical protein